MGTGRAPSASRPFVHLNCAVSADGRLAYADGRRALLSGPDDLRRVQELRASCDAILVGVGTVILDDPSLRVHWELLDRRPGPSPLRVILDSRGRTPAAAKVLDGTQPTLLVTAKGSSREFPSTVETVRMETGPRDVPAVLDLLRERGVRRLLVEGGASVLSAFLHSGLVDRLTVFVAPVLIGGSTAPPMMMGPEVEGAAGVVRLRLTDATRLGEGILLTWEPAGLPGSTPSPRTTRRTRRPTGARTR